MARVRELLPADFEEVYDTFLEQDRLHDSPEAWRPLFQPPWRSPDEPTGYALAENGRIVGVLGVLCSERTIGGRRIAFHNVHTWFVDEEHRGHSLLLMRPLSRLRDATVTDFSPSRPVVRISRRLGFRDLDATLKVLLPCRPGRESREFEITDDVSRLSQDEQRIAADHKAFCGHLVLTQGDATCLVAFDRVRSRVPHARIFHVSNPALFARGSRLVRRAIGERTKTRFATIERRLLGRRTIARSLDMPYSTPALFKSDSVSPEHVDGLYSEVLLHRSSSIPAFRAGVRQVVERWGLLSDERSLASSLFRRRPKVSPSGSTV